MLSIYSLRPLLLLSFLFLSLSLSSSSSSPSSFHFVAAGTKECMACTVMSGYVDQLAYYHDQSISHAIDTLCSDFSSSSLFDGICEGTLKLLLAAQLEKDFPLGIGPDSSCRSMGWCKAPLTQCTLFSPWPPLNPLGQQRKGRRKILKDPLLDAAGPSVISDKAFLSVEEWEEKHAEEQRDPKDAAFAFYELFQRRFPSSPPSSSSSSSSSSGPKRLSPASDGDHDGFSTHRTRRGSDWRGKDCDDANAAVYPGRLSTSGEDPSIDWNCNGIWGTNPSGQAYEEAFCSQTPPRGLIAMGDSMTAHFGLPVDWFRPPTMTNHTFDNFWPVADDSGDWPQCSATTAHFTNSSFANHTICPPSLIAPNSIYQRMRRRNLCMHRDYQNNGKNGADSVTFAPPDGYITSIYRNQKEDAPATVIFALIGNDVCQYPVDHFTPPSVFYSDMASSLQYLDGVLPSGSHVILQALVDGRVLFNTVHNRTHPAGMLYSTFYDYLNCINISPCPNWMNTNETVREMTWAHVLELNQQLEKLANSTHYNNFNIQFMDVHFGHVIANWTAEGKDPMQLIEPVDGFHGDTTGHALIAEHIWSWMEGNMPEAMGEINPMNADIIETFGEELNGY